jgi:hypothetical protein
MYLHRIMVFLQKHIPPWGYLLAIILYLDDTCVDFRGNRSFKPLVVSVGNYKYRIRASNDGKRCAGYIPKVKLPKKDPSMAGPRRAFNQAVLAHIVDNIEAYSNGFWLQLPFETTPRMFFPRLAFMATDWPEGQACTCVFAGAGKSRRNCRVCLIKRVDQGGGSGGAGGKKPALRTQHLMDQRRKQVHLKFDIITRINIIATVTVFTTNIHRPRIRQNQSVLSLHSSIPYYYHNK